LQRGYLFRFDVYGNATRLDCLCACGFFSKGKDSIQLAKHTCSPGGPESI
jgi:hypothetical protein